MKTIKSSNKSDNRKMHWNIYSCYGTSLHWYKNLASSVANLRHNNFNQDIVTKTNGTLLLLERRETEKNMNETKKLTLEEELAKIHCFGLCLICNRKGNLAKDCRQNRNCQQQIESTKKHFNGKTIEIKDQDSYATENNKIKKNGGIVLTIKKL
jgi:hypothetical protein